MKKKKNPNQLQMATLTSRRLKTIPSFYPNSNKNPVSRGFRDCFQRHLKADYFQGRFCTPKLFFFSPIIFKIHFKGYNFLGEMFGTGIISLRKTEGILMGNL